MKTHVVGWQMTLGMAAFWLAGCAAESPKAPPPAPPAPVKSHAGAAPVTSPPPAAAPATNNVYQQAAAKPTAPFEGEGWRSLFEGKSLKGWGETLFAGRGEVRCEAGLLVVERGDPFTGVNLTNEIPRMNYEVALDAMRVSGSDFFCGLTVPVGESCCSLIVGGWGGSLVGISSLDGMDASENETSRFLSFEQGRWYRIRLRVTKDRIEGWIDEEKTVDVVTTDKRINVRPGDIEMSQPFGLAAWSTSAAYREIRIRSVTEPASQKRR